MSIQRHEANTQTAGIPQGGQFKAQHRTEAPAPPHLALDSSEPVELTQYRSDIDGATVIEVDSNESTGRVRVVINDGVIYDDDPEHPYPGSTFGDLTDQSPEARQAAVKAGLMAHLRDFPEDAYALLETATESVRDAEHYFPQARMTLGYEEDGEWFDEPNIINPRTGQEDTLVAVDSSIRETELESDQIDNGNKSVTFDYDSSSDYDGVLYLTASDRLPVRLPEGWDEV